MELGGNLSPQQPPYVPTCLPSCSSLLKLKPMCWQLAFSTSCHCLPRVWLEHLQTATATSLVPDSADQAT